MGFKASEFLDPGRPLRRSGYLISGILLFGLKHNLDRLIARQFGRRWSLFNYWEPAKIPRITALPPADRTFFLALLGLAVPFVILGVLLTLRRLQDASLPKGLVALFFAPFVNLLFFLVLSMLPSTGKRTGAGGPRSGSRIDRFLPTSRWGSAAAAAAFAAIFGTGITALSVNILRSYGWGLFVGVPFCAGLVAALLYGYRQPRTSSESLGVACLSMVFMGLLVMSVAIEGAVCVVMAAPVGLGLACLGGWVGYEIQKQPRREFAGTWGALLALPLALPGLIGAEKLSDPEDELNLVRSSIEVAAPIDRVWQTVVNFPPLPPPREWIFRAGISYPTRAEISGHGAGATRRCVFSTGVFIEPIEAWDEPRLLQFRVAEQPVILTELTPYRGVHPPHLNGFFTSTRGEFRLTAISDRRTRLEGSTWYRHAIWPASYWRLWSDAIIHRIHMRVLEGVKQAAEGSEPDIPG